MAGVALRRSVEADAELAARRPGRSSARRWRSGSCSGTQSVSTAEPPSPSRVDDGDLGAELGGDQGRLVAAGAAADDHDTGHADASLVTGHVSHARSRRPGPLVCAPCLCTPPTAATSTRAGWASAARTPRCAAPAGWTGWRLTFGGEEHGWDGALATVVEDPLEQVFVALYDVTDEDDGRARRLGERRHRALPQDQGAGLARSTASCWPGSTCSTPTRAACPSASYLGILADAAEAADAPDDYVAALRARPCRSTRAADAADADRVRRVSTRPTRRRSPPRPPRVLAEKTGVERHDVALVMGSGWLPAADALGEATAELSTTDLPGFAPPAVAGHAGKIRSVRAGDREPAGLPRPHPLLRGPRRRAPSCTACAPPPRPAAGPSCSPTAAAACDEAWPPGTPVLISDHINLTGDLADRGRELRRPHRPLLRRGCARCAARSTRPSTRASTCSSPARTTRPRPRSAWSARSAATWSACPPTLEAIAAREAGMEVLGISPGHQPRRRHHRRAAQPRGGPRGRPRRRHPDGRAARRDRAADLSDRASGLIAPATSGRSAATGCRRRRSGAAGRRVPRTAARARPRRSASSSTSSSPSATSGAAPGRRSSRRTAGAPASARRPARSGRGSARSGSGCQPGHARPASAAPNVTSAAGTDAAIHARSARTASTTDRLRRNGKSTSVRRDAVRRRRVVRRAQPSHHGSADGSRRAAPVWPADEPAHASSRPTHFGIDARLHTDRRAGRAAGPESSSTSSRSTWLAPDDAGHGMVEDHRPLRARHVEQTDRLGVMPSCSQVNVSNSRPACPCRPGGRRTRRRGPSSSACARASTRRRGARSATVRDLLQGPRDDADDTPPAASTASATRPWSDVRAAVPRPRPRSASTAASRSAAAVQSAASRGWSRGTRRSVAREPGKLPGERSERPARAGPRLGRRGPRPADPRRARARSSRRRGRRRTAGRPGRPVRRAPWSSAPPGCAARSAPARTG